MIHSSQLEAAGVSLPEESGDKDYNNAGNAQNPIPSARKKKIALDTGISKDIVNNHYR